MLELRFAQLLSLPLLTALQCLRHVRAIHDAIASEHLAPWLPAHDLAGDCLAHTRCSLGSRCRAPRVMDHISFRLARLHACILAEPFPRVAHILHGEE